MKKCRGFDRTVNGLFLDWKTCMDNGTNKIRFEYCLVESTQIHYMRSVQDHSRGERIDLRLQKNVYTGCCSELDIFVPNDFFLFRAHFGGRMR